MSEADDEASIHELEETAFGLHRGVRRLIEESAHLSIPIRRSVAMIDAGALVVSRTRTDPGGQSLRSGKARRRWPDFRDHLLRRIHAEPRDRRQSFDRSLMRAQQLREFL